MHQLDATCRESGWGAGTSITSATGARDRRASASVILSPWTTTATGGRPAVVAWGGGFTCVASGAGSDVAGCAATTPIVTGRPSTTGEAMAVWVSPAALSSLITATAMYGVR